MNVTARPTEYRGIQYRSKCEAMFARWLELKNSDDVIVIYEPDWAEIEDYVPDFAVIRPLPDGERVPLFGTSVELIEYKPTRPTLTYVKETTKKLYEISRRELKENDVAEVMLTIYFGSVFSVDRGVFYFNPPSGFIYCNRNWLSGHEKSIRNFRFDLEAET